ncbi:hypothetical protein JZ751_019044, partial [Albula glossodonta]
MGCRHTRVDSKGMMFTSRFLNLLQGRLALMNLEVIETQWLHHRETFLTTAFLAIGAALTLNSSSIEVTVSPAWLKPHSKRVKGRERGREQALPAVHHHGPGVWRIAGLDSAQEGQDG